MTKRPDDPAQDRQAAINEMRAASTLIAQALYASTGTSDPPDTHPLVPDPLAPGAAAALHRLRERQLGPALTAATIHLGYAIRAFHAGNDMVETVHQAGESVAAGERAVDEEAVLHAIGELERRIASATHAANATHAGNHDGPPPLYGEPTGRAPMTSEKAVEEQGIHAGQDPPEVVHWSADGRALLIASDALGRAHRALEELRYLRAAVAVNEGMEALQPPIDVPGAAIPDPPHLAIDHEPPMTEETRHELGPL